jgi:hypothetical protein
MAYRKNEQVDEPDKVDCSSYGDIERSRVDDRIRNRL